MKTYVGGGQPVNMSRHKQVAMLMQDWQRTATQQPWQEGSQASEAQFDSLTHGDVSPAQHS